MSKFCNTTTTCRVLSTVKDSALSHPLELMWRHLVQSPASIFKIQLVVVLLVFNALVLVDYTCSHSLHQGVKKLASYNLTKKEM